MSQFAIMHFKSLCVSDTHSLESVRVDIDSRKRVKAEYRETQKWSRLQWWQRQDEMMFRAIEKSRESGTRQRRCVKAYQKFIRRLFIFPFSFCIEGVGKDFINISKILATLLYNCKFIVRNIIYVNPFHTGANLFDFIISIK